MQYSYLRFWLLFNFSNKNQHSLECDSAKCEMKRAKYSNSLREKYMVYLFTVSKYCLMLNEFENKMRFHRVSLGKNLVDLEISKEQI